MRNFITIMKRLLVIPATFDPDDFRRRQALNFALVVLLLASVIVLLVTVWDESLTAILTMLLKPEPDYGLINVFLIVLMSALLRLNRSTRTPTNLIGWILVLGLLLLFSISDSPEELMEGRSVFVWVVPITLSVVVLPPASVFGVDLLITGLFMYWAGFQYENFQIFTIAAIYVVSLISWLGMSIAERAICVANRSAFFAVADVGL